MPIGPGAKKAPALTPELKAQIMRLGAKELANEAGLKSLLASAPALLVAVPLIRLHLALPGAREQLLALLKKRAPELERSFTVADPAAMASGYDLSINAAQAKLLTPIVESQHRRTVENVRQIAAIFENKGEVNCVALVDAVLRDLLDLAQKFERNRATVRGG